MTDPQAAWVAKQKMRPFFAYGANYLIDNELGIIVDAEGTRANRIEENRAAVRMVGRVERRFDLKPERLAADTAYGSGRMLKNLVDRGIEPHIPVWDKSNETRGKFTRVDFTYDRARDLYICPGGKALTCTGRVDQGRILPYRASPRDCRSCALKPRCTSAPARKVSRDIDEEVREQVRALANTAAFAQSRRERKKVEMAVRPPQTHPRARPLAPPGTMRRPRRVPPRRHRPEPQETRQAQAKSAADNPTSVRQKELSPPDEGSTPTKSQNPARSRAPNVGFCQERTSTPTPSPTKSTKSAKG